MPKKFQGTNSKAVEARARKAEQHALAKQQVLNAAEDEYWHDDDKANEKKQQRKRQQEEKKMYNLAKKKELEQLYEAEQEALGKSQKSSTINKVTRAEINALKRNEEKLKLENEQLIKLEKNNISVQSDLLEENINKVVSEDMASGSNVEARSVEEAISALGIQEDLDRHPERRLKSSFKKFEQEYLPKLKSENPSMRMSQLRQILRKQWQKSPENPLNQTHSAYNAK